MKVTYLPSSGRRDGGHLGGPQGEECYLSVTNNTHSGRIKSRYIEKEIEHKINVFQDLGEYVYLLELEVKTDAEHLVSNGFDVAEIHVDCSPPHGKFLNVSIMGLRSYIDDDEVISALSDNGEIKSEVIRLKYKADHELAGLENGNSLVKMVLA